ncbi:MAG: purine-nucleoside phosphorylase, partial [Rhodothermales bacterium]|nr:purine-nucleoside phosphorylase [Rhodothermales bacterium]
MQPLPAAPTPDDEVQAAVAAVREREARVPELALVLGSGLGGLADAADAAHALSTAELPGYPRSSVEGHRGRLVFGRLAGRDVVFVQGRVHLYEGHPVRALTFPVRLAHALGARRLLVTNAAGGINPAFGPGTLMFISDHLNAAGAGPLARSAGLPAGAPPGLPGRLPGLHAPYDPAWLDRAEAVALRLKIRTRRGVYVWAGGPSYETPAEVRMFARMGADAVGMSTVPEVVQARLLGMRVLGLSTITNPAAGLGGELLAHEDVLAVGRT